MGVTVTAIPCLSDNYAWLLKDEATGTIGLCDPGESAPMIPAIEAAGGKLDWIILTHHHGDHIDGVADLVARYGAKVVGATADEHRLPKLDQKVVEGDFFSLGESRARVIDTPGHTRGHIAFYFADGGVLLCGDTLFALGCGRLLEGTPAEMFLSLTKLAALPSETLVCCGHEYTLSNARYALTVEPDNAALQSRAAAAEALRAEGKPTVPVTVGQEMAANPFLRAKDVDTLARIRLGKDNFRG
ncbi:hydroxyacylglutathione hydrolase [Acetobacteraceae bacterium H6797]|nr:hydroxyacylglutathione hydrolase [Acetobacteraceae bacterium H6797]